MSAEQYPLPGDWPEEERRERSIQAAFERFDRENPAVFEEFRKLAEALLLTRPHYGAKSIFEVIRYHRALKVEDHEEAFRLNNNYSSRYSRKLMEMDARFVGFFETRELKSE